MNLSRDELARYGREYLLAGHLIDRAGMPLVLGEHGREAMQEIAIDEWMAASPLYTRRMQQLLGFEGDDVATIFKGMQLDIGAPPEFMDFRYRVHDEAHGEFWLEHCGALMDVEPMGEELVVAMCHDIEDPTFDATAHATNPRARVRPIHRPPRQPAERHPHCHWTVEIGGEAAATTAPEGATALAATQAARLEVHRPVAASNDGRSDYAGDLDPDLSLESFSTSTLVSILDEVCLQGHLLALAFAHSARQRFGAQAAASLSLRQFTGVAGLTARRLSDERFGGPSPAPSEPASPAEAVARVLELHPAFRPRTYVDLRVTPDTHEGSDALVLELGPCPAREEEEPSWIGLLVSGHTEPLEAIVQAVDPRARIEPLDPPSSGDRAGAVSWRVVFDPSAAPVRPADEVELAAFSTGAEFTFVGDPRRRSQPGHDEPASRGANP